MLKKALFCAAAAFVCLQPAFAGVIYQNFEPDNGSSLDTWSVGTSLIATADRTEAVHLGRNSLRVTSDWWSGFGVLPQFSAAVPFDLKQTNNDRLVFWIYAMPNRTCYVYGCEPGAENTVGTVFYDNNHYAAAGFEVWTVQTFHYEQWTKLKVLFSQLPPDFDLTHVTKIEFKNFMPGKYFFDDIHAVREDRAYQSFAQEDRKGSADSDYGWKWNDADTAALSVDGEPAFSGAHSWKLTTAGKWGGTGIQSQEQKYIDNNGTPGQTFWSVDLAPQNNDRLTFWVYNQNENGMDNNYGVQFYDNGAHNSDDTKVEIWPRSAAAYGRWTRITVMFSDLLKQAPDLNLSDINKIQVQSYWAGTFYLDEFAAAGPQPIIKEASLAQGSVQWSSMDGAVNYRLQESTNGPSGPWGTVYSGPANSFSYTRISKSWLRVRWEEGFTNKNTIPYASGWSDPVEYLPPAVVFNYKSLQQGRLEWNAIPNAGLYEVQTGPSKTGPWAQFYRGHVPQSSLGANPGSWYRLRALRQDNNNFVIDQSPWSRPQVYGPNFVAAAGTVIKDAGGTGDELVLKGVNLGAALLIEPWMTDLGQQDDPALQDDWSIRAALRARFGDARAKDLLRTFQNSYLNPFDYDRLVDNMVSLARLPFFYRILQDDDGNWNLDAQGRIDFSALDRVVDALSDRGIYTVLDLHGAPGSQNGDANSGRAGPSQLFASDGEVYRVRTVQLWTELARHYKDNPWVLGYDLLNEPVGAGADTAALADLYDRLYRAIRAVDPNHMVIMEGVWFTDPNDPEPDPNKKRQVVDWDTLPMPSARGWTNVMYQFHFYHWNFIDANGKVVSADEDLPSHKAFIDQKVQEAASKQPQYNVPVMVGEFYGFGLGPIWQYYLQNFNARKWSWTSWSYKYEDSPSNWGLVYHSHKDEESADIQDDYDFVLSRKFSEYATSDYHAANVTLQSIMDAALGPDPQAEPPPSPPATPSPGGMTSGPNGTFSYTGGVSDTPGSISFYWAPCSDIPPGTHPCNYGDAAITYWSRSLVKGYVPPDALMVIERYSIHGQEGGDLYPTMRRPSNHAPTLALVGGQTINAGQPVNIDLAGADRDGDILGYTAWPMPRGAVMTGNHFSWTPDYDQPGSYAVTFRASDGELSAQRKATITVKLPVPDLTVTGLTATAASVKPGTLINTTVTVKNRLAPDAGPFKISYHLSRDNSYGGDDDIAVGQESSAASLAGQTSLKLTNQLAAPDGGTGSYHVCAKADSANVIYETSEVNNTLCSSAQVTYSFPDLAITSLSGPASGTMGRNITLTDTVKNQGALTVSSSTTGYYLSTDASITTADRRIGTRSVPSLAAGASNSASTAVKIPAGLAVGVYYLGAIADYANTRAEADEANNALAGNQILVSR